MTEGDNVMATDEAIETILRSASRRATPAGMETQRVRETLRAEWRAVTGRRRRRGMLVSLAAAAMLLVAVGMTARLLSVPSALPVPVGSIDKSTGSIYLLGDEAELRETSSLSELLAGQALLTGHDSGVSIAWRGGGSVRIDEDTRIEIVSPAEILLRSGRVYVDTTPLTLQAGITQSSMADFAVRTDHGVVRHVGTQFMTGVDARGLTVSVREGRVTVAGAYHDAQATAGQRLTFAGRNRPTVTSISTHGDDWLWVARMTPAIDVESLSAYEFITWVGRESGLGIRFASDEIERRARDTRLHGGYDGEPRQALRALLQTTDLVSQIEDGWIVISGR